MHRLAEAWNVLAEELGLPKVSRLSEGRKRKATIRLTEWAGDSQDGRWQSTWEAIATGIRGWTFGHGEKGWRTNFDYLLANDTNWRKLIERGQSPETDTARDPEVEAMKAELKQILGGKANGGAT